METPSLIRWQLGQALQGSGLSPRARQFTALARIFAAVVFPVPRGPLKR